MDGIKPQQFEELCAKTQWMMTEQMEIGALTALLDVVDVIRRTSERQGGMELDEYNEWVKLGEKIQRCLSGPFSGIDEVEVQ